MGVPTESKSGSGQPRAAELSAFTLTILMQHAGKLLDDHLRLAFKRIGLHPSQGHILHLLGRREGFSQSELTAMMKVAAPTVSGILNRMDAAGLIERRADSDDERVARVYLTRRGRRKVDAVRRVVDEAEHILIDGLTRAQLRSVHTILRKLRDNLGGGPPGPEPPVTSIIP